MRKWNVCDLHNACKTNDKNDQISIIDKWCVQWMRRWWEPGWNWCKPRMPYAYAIFNRKRVSVSLLNNYLMMHWNECVIRFYLLVNKRKKNLSLKMIAILKCVTMGWERERTLSIKCYSETHEA